MKFNVFHFIRQHCLAVFNNLKEEEVQHKLLTFCTIPQSQTTLVFSLLCLLLNWATSILLSIMTFCNLIHYVCTVCVCVSVGVQDTQIAYHFKVLFFPIDALQILVNMKAGASSLGMTSSACVRTLATKEKCVTCVSAGCSKSYFTVNDT